MAVTVGMVFGVLNGFAPTLIEAKKQGTLWLFDLGMNRWASEVLFSLWIQRYSDVYNTSVPTSHFGYELDQTGRNFGIMIAIAIAYRAAAFLLLVLVNREKQK